MSPFHKAGIVQPKHIAPGIADCYAEALRKLIAGSRIDMWSYYLYMGLLITTLVLWAIVAMRDDGHESGSDPTPSDTDAAATKKD